MYPMLKAKCQDVSPAYTIQYPRLANGCGNDNTNALYGFNMFQ